MTKDRDERPGRFLLHYPAETRLPLEHVLIFDTGSRLTKDRDEKPGRFQLHYPAETPPPLEHVLI